MSKHPLPAVGAIIRQGDAVLLVRRGTPPNQGQWSVPGGSIEWGETIEAAVRREVREETGLTVAVGALAGISEVIAGDNGTPAFHYVVLDYFAEIVAGTPHAASDAAEVAWIPLSALSTLDVTPGLLAFFAKLRLIAG